MLAFMPPQNQTNIAIEFTDELGSSTESQHASMGETTAATVLLTGR